MKKTFKVLSVVIVLALIAAVVSVSAFAADPVLTVKHAPNCTVYYDGIDTYENELYVSVSGLVLTLTEADGTTTDIVYDDFGDMCLFVEDYVIGENTVIVEYTTDDGVTLTTSFTVTVEESPVTSVEITKMPTKTQYDMDKDIIKREGFDIKKRYEVDPEGTETILQEYCYMSYEIYLDCYADDPDLVEYVLDRIFGDADEIILLDVTGWEALVSFNDGTTQAITYEDDYLIYNGSWVSIYVYLKNDTVAEGNNPVVLEVGGTTTEFNVNVVKEGGTQKPDDNKPSTETPADKPTDKPAEKPTQKPDDVKNPVIPNTDGGVSLAVAAVAALVSGAGIALIPSKKKEQF